MRSNKRNKGNKSKARHKPNNNKPNTTPIRTIKHSEQDTVKLVDNDTGKLIPTKADKAKIEAVKKAQREYHKAKLEAQEALRKVKQEFEALDGSESIKILKAELEGKIEAKQAEVVKAREAFKALVNEYNSLLVEYQELTGISKKAVKANGKISTGTHINANGSWIPTIKLTDKATVKIIIKHAPTNTIFEDTLCADGTGMISHAHWLDLRERFYQFDGKIEGKPKSVFYDLYQSLDNGAKANFRAFLYPRLYNLISQVKAIADKID